MRLRPDQLSRHLERHGLGFLYLIGGDEPLQTAETQDALRAYARSQGVEERIVLVVEPGFDWKRLGQETESLSLFSARRLIELRLGDSTPGKEGGEALRLYAERMLPDVTLVVTFSALDKKAQDTAWFKAVDKVGLVIQVWPVEANALPQWIQRRMATKGLQASQEAATFIAEHVEGNLLAASQEIELLRLLNDRPRIELEEAMAALSDNSRYDVFCLVDAALAGDPFRVRRVLTGLQREGVEPVLVNWALTRELRTLCLMAGKAATGKALEALYSEFRIWEKRRPLVNKALRRYSIETLRQLLLAAGRIDRTIKGTLQGVPWEELAWLCAALAGKREALANLQP